MFRPKRRYQPPTPPSQRIIVVRVAEMEHLVSAIADLTTAVTNLVAVEQQVVDALLAQPPTGTVLTAADQAALDTAVTTVQSVTSTLAAALPTATPAPATEPTPTPVDGGTTPSA